MVTLREVLKQAEMEGVAIGHFNVSDLITLKAVFESASDQNVPVIVGVSEGERQLLGVRQIATTPRAICVKGSRLQLKRNSSWKKQESTPWHLRSAICMECSRAW